MTTTAILHSYLFAASAHDWDTALGLFTDDFQLTLLPASAGHPAQTKSQFVKTLEGSVKKWFAPGALQHTVNEVYETKSEGTIIAHVNSDGTSKLGTPWHNEYMLIVEVQGNKIRRITEFMDSGFMKGFVDAEAKATKA
ncbi:hypothetical protein BDZ89DRAFT_1062693 [Hymenopellis radicata]|nr:hypothetical protein BDZ89DRAFT_1062693 [Hymenopellis radicata]